MSDGQREYYERQDAGNNLIAEEPPRSWQSALHQLADTLAPGADVEIDPMGLEVSCARIAETVGRRIAELESELEHWRYEGGH